jgi:hypothetical protein
LGRSARRGNQSRGQIVSAGKAFAANLPIEAKPLEKQRNKKRTMKITTKLVSARHGLIAARPALGELIEQ